MAESIAAAGFRVDQRDVVTTRWIFAPLSGFPAEGTFEAALGPFRFAAISREELGNFVTEALVFGLSPAARASAA
jgi:hypothetical protein